MATAKEHQLEASITLLRDELRLTRALQNGVHRGPGQRYGLHLLTPLATGPVPANAIIWARAAAVRLALRSHLLDERPHLIVDTALAATLAAIPAATTEGTLVTLTNGIFDAYTAHADSAGVHYHDDPDTIALRAPVTNTATAVDALNDLITAILEHAALVPGLAPGARLSDV